MDVEIIYREYIKPSSPTPSNLRTHKLCLFDQFLDQYYASDVLYYPPEKNVYSSTDVDYIIFNRLQLLKQSLSETLSHFYPLAGKLKDDFSVDCNDEGIYFVEARAKNPLNEFLSQPNVSLISKFVPKDGTEQSGQVSGAHVAKIQVTTFTCGGLAVCTSLSHLVGDAATVSLFLKTWAAIARKNVEEAVFPNYDASSLFPSVDEDPKDANLLALLAVFLKTGRPAMRRFVFDGKAIADLKARASSSYVQNPSRVEVVSALLFKRITVAFRTKSGFYKPHLLSHVVNLRRKMKTPILDYSIGNIFWHACALFTEDEVELDDIAYRLREAIEELNADFVKSLQGDEGLLNLRKSIKVGGELYFGAEDRIEFSSWCNFGLYNIDFGWGKPIWNSSAGWYEFATVYHNFINLMDTRSGNGVEAWVFLPEEDMKLLELDEELLTFATMDPSPLDI